MSRTFLSIGAGGPRIGLVLGRKDMARAFATIAIPFGVLAVFEDATEHFGSVLGFIASSAFVALLWFAWTSSPGNGPLFHPRPKEFLALFGALAAALAIAIHG
jgi:hypothetical protein